MRKRIDNSALKRKQTNNKKINKKIRRTLARSPSNLRAECDGIELQYVRIYFTLNI